MRNWNLEPVSRRAFLKGASASIAALSLAPHLRFRANEKLAGPTKLLPFRYGEVRLLGGPLGNQFDRIHRAYVALDNDRLLKPFRHRAGLPDPGEELGGWYQGPDANNPGQCFGQYLSGLSRFAGVTRDASTYAKVRNLVAGFGQTVAPDGFSYADKQAATFAPAYDIDKNQIGLIDAYQCAGLAEAKDLLPRIVRGAVPYLPSRAFDQYENPRQSPVDESYTLPENLLNTYELTGDAYFLAVARRFFLDGSYFDPLARGTNVLPGLHAYSHVNALSSACKAYAVLGDNKYLLAALNAWEMIERTQQFASGGWGPNEKFVEPGKGLLGESLLNTHASFETPCGSYAHCKLARYLMGFTGESRYGDVMERVIYNTVLGAKDPSGTGQFFYYSDYHAGAQKTYHSDKYPCCSGTLPQVVADYAINCYFHDESGLYVNLFAPSQVRWNLRGQEIRLAQNTRYPDADSSELRFTLDSDAEFSLFVRIPGWLESHAQISVNDKPLEIPAERGSFAAIRRKWKNNDTVQIALPFTLRTDPVDDRHPDIIALMWGPLMLVAIDAPLEIPGNAILSSAGAMKARPYRASEFELIRPAGSVTFKPFYKVQSETYTTYMRQT